MMIVSITGRHNGRIIATSAEAWSNAKLPKRKKPSKVPDQKGSANSRCKITEQQVYGIRELHASGVAITELAKRFSISYPHTYDIVSRKRWGHLPERAST